jgi:hypothetical protein
MEEFVDRYPSEGVIASDTLASGHYVSTIWLGMDLRMEGTGQPEIYQTMVIAPGRPDDPWEGHAVSYASADDAAKGHAEVVAAIELDLSLNRKRCRCRKGGR